MLNVWGVRGMSSVLPSLASSDDELHGLLSTTDTPVLRCFSCSLNYCTPIRQPVESSIGGVMVSASDLRSSGRGFDYWPFRYSNNNSGQVVHTHVPLSPSSIIWYRSRAGKVTTVCGRGVAYHPHNWAVSAAHCRLRAMEAEISTDRKVAELWEGDADHGQLYLLESSNSIYHLLPPVDLPTRPPFVLPSTMPSSRPSCLKTDVSSALIKVAPPKNMFFEGDSTLSAVNKLSTVTRVMCRQNRNWK